MKTTLKNNITALILSSIFLLSTIAHANPIMRESEDSETQIESPLPIKFINSFNFNTNANRTLLSSTTKNNTKTTKSAAEPTQLDYLRQIKDWESLIKTTASCSTTLVRTGCNSSFSTNKFFKSSLSLIKIEPKQKIVVDIDFSDDSAENAWAEYEMVLPYENPIDFRTVTGVIKVTKDSTASYVNNLPYAVYAYAVVYNNLGSGITITAKVDKKK